ncbi:TnsD family Tn7-like transposition protein [Vibrio hibernica]|uniref:TnsD family Tn7-like transposition protein n=1 Tax=Vibrio hibernica TaxID=2587465 RepID=UPI00188087C6|nr:TnsD family Tn7-like transposition protein [Vibrio hibernica]
MQLPSTLPDETFHSRICRHFSYSGLTTAQYLEKILGNEKSTFHPYFVGDLSRMAVLINEYPIDIIKYQSLNSFFSYFLPKYKNIINDSNAKVSQVIRACQVSTFREREQLSIKFCPQCAKDEIQEFGVSYWHCLHQISGVEVCSKHHVWLIHRALPERSHISNYFFPSEYAETKNCSPLAFEFVNYCQSVLNQTRNAELKVPFNYKEIMKDCGFITLNGSIRRKTLSAELYYLAQQVLPRGHLLLPRSKSDYSYWIETFKGSLNQPPFKHLLMSFYLNHVATRQLSLPLATEPTLSKDLALEKSCCDLLLRGFSMADVGRQINKSRCYVKSVALRNKIPVNLKPKIITEELKVDVIALARKGFHRKVIANKYKISTGSVELIISTTNGLVEWRRKCKCQSTSRRYKTIILRYIYSNSHSLRKDVKNACEAAFFWLYQHDRNWLEDNLPRATKTKHVDKINWEQLDVELAEKVIEILRCNSKQISRSELDRQLGGHGWLISKKEKLPKTLNIFLSYKW